MPASNLAIRATPAQENDPSELVHSLRDRDWERRYILAYARGHWLQAAHDVAEDMRRKNIQVTPADLELELMLAVFRSRNINSLIVDNPVGYPIEARIEMAVRDYFALVVTEAVDDGG
jgi:hypothetical protein